MKKLLALDNLRQQIETSQRETRAAFGDDRLIVERYIYPARHVEVQVFGDGKRAIALGERECSLQRRHQKIIEESPSTAVDEPLRQKLFDSAVSLAESVGYKNAGTVEFLLGPDGNFYFLEVNARLQVEHPVTEMCAGLDLVKMQIEIAQGDALMKQEDVQCEGHAIEARLNAEDPYNNFMPSSGRVLHFSCDSTWDEFDPPRIDTALGDVVSSHYDSLIAKYICYGEDRDEACRALIGALKTTHLLGLYTNQGFLIDILDSDWFASGNTFTGTVDELDIGPREVTEELVAVAALVFRGPVRQSTNAWSGEWRLA